MSIIFKATLMVEVSSDKSKDSMLSAFDPDIEVGRETVFGACKDAYFCYAEKLKHAYALVGFAVNPNCLHDFRSFDDEGKLVDACEFVVRKIYYDDDDLDARMPEFHASLTDYKWRRGTFSRGYVWNDSKLDVAGHIHEWHELYSVPHHSTFGEVAMIVSAQLVGPGGTERDWQKVKHVWDGRGSFDSDNVEKAVKVYEEHRREMALVTEGPCDMPLYRFWTEEEMDFDLGLEKFVVNIDMTADNTVIFNNFIEEWEEDAIKHKKNVNEALLLKKYRGIRFYDTDDSLVYEIESNNLEWKKRDKADRGTPCYVILAKAVRRAVSDNGDDSEDESEDDPVAYHINSELHSMISDSRSEHPSNLQLRCVDQSTGST